jgi:signal peptidase I
MRTDATSPTHAAPVRSRLLAAVRELGVLGLFTIVLYVAIHAVVEPVRVEGFSMERTLDDQDYLVATTIDYRLHPPRRGDIVILRGTVSDPRNLIKRVVGLPGDHLVIRGDRVCIGGRTLTEPYVNRPAGGELSAGEIDQVIPAGEYYVMGDNRGVSMDSRSFGPVSADRIEARAWLRVLPLGRLGPVDRGGPVLSSAAGCG